jgi:hypothetical protein
MISKNLAIVVIGIIISLLIAVLVNPYAGGILLILVLALGMSLFIMEDSKVLPDVHATLTEDAKNIVVRNRGNAEAVDVKVEVVPHDIEIKRERMVPDESFLYPLSSMMQEGKAIITFTDKGGREFTGRDVLSPGMTEDDMLKPMFPLFKWK